MKNVTLALDDQTLKAGRAYAQAHNTSLNALIRTLLRRTVLAQESGNRLQEFYRIADRVKPDSRGRRWRRDDLYTRG